MSDGENPFTRQDGSRLKAAKQHAARLAHDVGKHIARAARNIPPGDIPDVLTKMLLKDLYATDGTHRASALFETLTAPLDAAYEEAWLGPCREKLARIDTLEPAIHRGDVSAIREAAGLAVSVEKDLKALYRFLDRAFD
jgi:hypothetical protein